jgi:hypothetical protein
MQLYYYCKTLHKSNAYIELKIKNCAKYYCDNKNIFNVCLQCVNSRFTSKQYWTRNNKCVLHYYWQQSSWENCFNSSEHLRAKENKEKLETKKTSQLLTFLAVMKIICAFSNKILKQKYFLRIIKNKNRNYTF